MEETREGEVDPKEKLRHGAQANYTGNSLEGFVYNTLIRKGYDLVEHDAFEAGRFMDQPIFTTHYPIAKSIYDTQLFCDFLLFHPTKHPDDLIIESKWQQSRGSVDEKFPFLVMNIKERYPHATIIVLDGDGYKPKADAWLRARIDGKLLHVSACRSSRSGRMGMRYNRAI